MIIDKEQSFIPRIWNAIGHVFGQRGGAIGIGAFDYTDIDAPIRLLHGKQPVHPPLDLLDQIRHAV